MTNDNGLLAIQGPAAKEFLQGQLTCDMEKITPTHSSLGAHCNPQGRIISFFRIFLLNDTYYLQMPRSMVPIAHNAFKKYAVFFKVTLTDASEQTIPLPTTTTLENIRAGIPAIYPETSEKFLPHELNLPQLNAVSFDKGCYTGQEIIARMHYRGKLKSHLQKITLQLTTPPQRGTDLNIDDKNSSTVVDFATIGYNQYELLMIMEKNPC